MAKNILKEAIADAKAVREVALANAKAALEEAFTPRLQSMLSAKLSEELDEGNLLKEDMSIEDVYNDAQKQVKDIYDIDVPMNVVKQWADNYQFPYSREVDPEDEDQYILVYDFGTEERGDFMEWLKDNNLREGYMEGEKEDLDEEIDLEEILSELELDENDDSKEETVDEAKDEEEDKLDEMEVNYKAETANRVGYQADYVHEGNENFDLDALLEEINNLDEDEDVKEVKEKEVKEVEEAVNPLANELNETKAALNTLKSELNEVNLLNSKLLYVNRIFKANNLSEGQKLRVVETLDNASNVKEAKLIYETIKDTFTISKEKKTTPKKSIRENFGMASKAAGLSTAQKKPILNESNDMMARMQKLANIKIN